MADARGLSSEEAKALHQRWGPNELPASKRKPLWRMALGVLQEPMLLLLLAGASIYFLLGKPQDSVLLLFSMAFIVGIAVYQERRSMRALEALKDLSSPRARVIRDGGERAIPARELVPGDCILLKEGDRVPADARLMSGLNIEADESLLTGESRPVLKQEASSMILSGTLITSGLGEAQVVATGLHTEVGKIGTSLSAPDESKTRLQKEITFLARRFGILGMTFCFLIMFAYVVTRGDWAQGFLAGIAAAMALLPEEFPVILTIFLALGAWRLSKQRVLVRQTAATENLGGVTVLCVDKTGTLTKNQMTVGLLGTPGESIALQEDAPAVVPEAFHCLVTTAALASQQKPFDPMELALQNLVLERIKETGSLSQKKYLVKAYALSPSLPAMSHVWQMANEETFLVAMKGAPESVLDLCHLKGDIAAKVRAHVEAISQQGFRVLGVAKAEWKGSPLPADQRDFQFQYLGLIGFIDPLRPGAQQAVRECQAAGIRVMMITGDHPGTACKIAAEAGIQAPQRFLTGAELAKMDDQKLGECLQRVSVFARMIPSQKLRIVNALKARGEVVAMTGDGVNDAPSLKWADVGIAMGGRGTDVAREAADLIVLDDDFKSIVGAIRLGRRIFANIQRAMSFVFATHFPIAMLAIVPVMAGLPLLLFPAHIVFLELIIDPACTLIFEAEGEDKETMMRPPRNLNDRLFEFKDIFFSSLQGATVFVVVLLLFMRSLSEGHSADQARTLAFVAFVLSNLGLILASEAPTALAKNRYFWSVLALALAALVLVLTIPSLRQVFYLDVVSGADVMRAVFGAGISTLVSVGIRFFLRSKPRHGTKNLALISKK